MIKERNFGLDLVRAIAVSFVLFHHWLGVYAARYNFFAILGFYGVEIFFVLSGFLIGNILIKAYFDGSYFNPKTVFTFWVRRWMRTLPLYYFILLVHIVISIRNHQHVLSLWKFFFFVQNIFIYRSDNHDFFGVSWSLSIEEWFYLAFPVVLLACNFLGRKFLSKKGVIVSTIVLFMISMLLIRVYFSFYGSNVWNDQFRKAVVCRIDSIAFGVLLALGNVTRRDFILRNKKYMLVAGLILLSLGALIFVTDIKSNYQMSLGRVSFFSKTLLFDVVSLGVFLVIPWFYYFSVREGLARKFITGTSRISYSLYLVHLFVLGIVLKYFPPTHSLGLLIVSLILFLAVSAVISTFTYTFIEKKFLDIRNKISVEKHNPV